VYVLQQALIAQGFAIPAGATGYYGTRTTAAVKKFQKAQGWTGSAADGIPGSGTLKRLGL
jgi:peptidoglycan hydrolase-like protein with peptidoglycan-binding domain